MGNEKTDLQRQASAFPTEVSLLSLQICFIIIIIIISPGKRFRSVWQVAF